MGELFKQTLMLFYCYIIVVFFFPVLGYIDTIL